MNLSSSRDLDGDNIRLPLSHLNTRAQHTCSRTNTRLIMTLSKTIIIILIFFCHTSTDTDTTLTETILKIECLITYVKHDIYKIHILAA